MPTSPTGDYSELDELRGVIEQPDGTPLSSVGGDVRAAGNNNFSGDNTHSGDESFSGDVTFTGNVNLGGATIIYEVPEDVDAQGTPVVWLDSTGIGAVDEWLAEGYSEHTAVQATVGKQPTPNTSGDFPYYSFANVDLMTIAAVDGTAWTEGTMIVVARETIPNTPHVGVIARLGGAGDGTFGTFGLHTYLQRIFGEGIANDGTPATDSPVYNTGEWHVYWVRRTATENWLGVDGMKGSKESTNSVLPLAIPLPGMAIGSDDQADALPFVGDIACVIVDDEAWSFERLRAVSLGLCQRFNIAQGPQVWCFGDSLFNGWSNFYDVNNPTRLIGESFGYRTVYPVSRVGRKTETAVAEFNDLVAPFIRPINGVRPVVLFELGANDFLNSIPAADSYANMVELCALAHHYGAEVYVVTPAAAGVVGAQDTIRLAYSALLLAGGVTLAEGFIEMHDAPIVGDQANTGNTTYYVGDTVHWKGPTSVILQGLLNDILYPTSGGGGNPFDQDLNTTDNVTFISVDASFFSGDGSLLTNVSAATAAMTNETSDTTCFLLFTTTSTPGAVAVKTNTGLTLNASTGAVGMAGNLDLGANGISAGTLTLSGDIIADDISAATVSGAVTGSFNGAVGNTTPSTGSFTTLAASGTVTVSNGTIIGGAGNMTITSGTGASRTLTLKTTTSGSTATDALTIGATQVVNLPGTSSASSATTGTLTVGNGTAATNVGIGGGNINAGAAIDAAGIITAGNTFIVAQGGGLQTSGRGVFRAIGDGNYVVALAAGGSQYRLNSGTDGVTVKNGAGTLDGFLTAGNITATGTFAVTGASVFTGLVTATAGGIAGERYVAGALWDGAGAVPATGLANGVWVAPMDGTITGWSIAASVAAVSTSITVKVCRKAAGGTAIPTTGDAINSSGVSLSAASGTFVRSNTTSDFSVGAGVTVTKGDVYSFNLTAVNTATWVKFELEMRSTA